MDATSIEESNWNELIRARSRAPYDSVVPPPLSAVQAQLFAQQNRTPSLYYDPSVMLEKQQCVPAVTGFYNAANITATALNNTLNSTLGAYQIVNNNNNYNNCNNIIGGVTPTMKNINTAIPVPLSNGEDLSNYLSGTARLPHLLVHVDDGTGFANASAHHLNYAGRRYGGHPSECNSFSADAQTVHRDMVKLISGWLNENGYYDTAKCLQYEAQNVFRCGYQYRLMLRVVAKAAEDGNWELALLRLKEYRQRRAELSKQTVQHSAATSAPKGNIISSTVYSTNMGTSMNEVNNTLTTAAAANVVENTNYTSTTYGSINGNLSTNNNNSVTINATNSNNNAGIAVATPEVSSSSSSAVNVGAEFPIVAVGAVFGGVGTASMQQRTTSNFINATSTTTTTADIIEETCSDKGIEFLLLRQQFLEVVENGGQQASAAFKRLNKFEWYIGGAQHQLLASLLACKSITGDAVRRYPAVFRGWSVAKGRQRIVGELLRQADESLNTQAYLTDVGVAPEAGELATMVSEALSYRLLRTNPALMASMALGGKVPVLHAVTHPTATNDGSDAINGAVVSSTVDAVTIDTDTALISNYATSTVPRSGYIPSNLSTLSFSPQLPCLYYVRSLLRASSVLGNPTRQLPPQRILACFDFNTPLPITNASLSEREVATTVSFYKSLSYITYFRRPMLKQLANSNVNIHCSKTNSNGGITHHHNNDIFALTPIVEGDQLISMKTPFRPEAHLFTACASLQSRAVVVLGTRHGHILQLRLPVMSLLGEEIHQRGECEVVALLPGGRINALDLLSITPPAAADFCNREYSIEADFVPPQRQTRCVNGGSPEVVLAVISGRVVHVYNLSSGVLISKVLNEESVSSYARGVTGSGGAIFGLMGHQHSRRSGVSGNNAIYYNDSSTATGAGGGSGVSMNSGSHVRNASFDLLCVALFVPNGSQYCHFAGCGSSEGEQKISPLNNADDNFSSCENTVVMQPQQQQHTSFNNNNTQKTPPQVPQPSVTKQTNSNSKNNNTVVEVETRSSYTPLLCAVGGENGEVIVFDVYNTEYCTYRHKLHTTSAMSLCFASSGNSLYVGHRDGAVRVLDIMCGIVIKEFYPSLLSSTLWRHIGAVSNSATIIPSRRTSEIISGIRNDVALLEDIAQQATAICDIAISSNGMLLAVSHTNSRIHLVDLPSGEMLPIYLAGHRTSSRQPSRVCFGATSRIVVSTSEDGFLHVWDLSEATALQHQRRSRHHQTGGAVLHEKGQNSSIAGGSLIEIGWHPEGETIVTLTPVKRIPIRTGCSTAPPRPRDDEMLLMGNSSAIGARSHQRLVDVITDLKYDRMYDVFVVTTEDGKALLVGV